MGGMQKMKALLRFRDKNFPDRCNITFEIKGEGGADLDYWVEHYKKFANTPKYIMTCESVDVYEWDEEK